MVFASLKDFLFLKVAMRSEMSGSDVSVNWYSFKIISLKICCCLKAETVNEIDFARSSRTCWLLNDSVKNLLRRRSFTLFLIYSRLTGIGQDFF